MFAKKQILSTYELRDMNVLMFYTKAKLINMMKEEHLRFRMGYDPSDGKYEKVL